MSSHDENESSKFKQKGGEMAGKKSALSFCSILLQYNLPERQGNKMDWDIVKIVSEKIM